MAIVVVVLFWACNICVAFYVFLSHHHHFSISVSITKKLYWGWYSDFFPLSSDCMQYRQSYYSFCVHFIEATHKTLTQFTYTKKIERKTHYRMKTSFLRVFFHHTLKRDQQHCFVIMFSVYILCTATVKPVNIASRLPCMTKIHTLCLHRSMFVRSNHFQHSLTCAHVEYLSLFNFYTNDMFYGFLILKLFNNKKQVPKKKKLV